MSFFFGPSLPSNEEFKNQEKIIKEFYSKMNKELNALETKRAQLNQDERSPNKKKANNAGAKLRRLKQLEKAKNFMDAYGKAKHSLSAVVARVMKMLMNTDETTATSSLMEALDSVTSLVDKLKSSLRSNTTGGRKMKKRVSKKKSTKKSVKKVKKVKKSVKRRSKH